MRCTTNYYSLCLLLTCHHYRDDSRDSQGASYFNHVLQCNRGVQKLCPVACNAPFSVALVRPKKRATGPCSSSLPTRCNDFQFLFDLFLSLCSLRPFLPPLFFSRIHSELTLAWSISIKTLRFSFVYTQNTTPTAIHLSPQLSCSSNRLPFPPESRITTNLTQVTLGWMDGWDGGMVLCVATGLACLLACISSAD